MDKSEDKGMREKIYIEYVDEGKVVKGIFELLEQKENYIKIKSNKNILIIPYHKVNKIKLKGGNKL